MALLTPEDLENINRQLHEADSAVRRVTGLDIKGVCKDFYGTTPCCEKIGIVPVTSGNGIIGNFSESLHAITEYFGFDSFVTDIPDVSGYYEAVRNGAQIILMADDNTFLAHNLKNGKIANNQPCTGIIYAEIASRYLKADSKDVLAVGLGKVGFPGVAHFVHKGFRVYGYDADSTILEKTASSLGITPFDPNNPRKFSIIFEATPCADTVPESVISENCVISTPGIPCAISNELQKKYGVELVMEPLGIGTASMLYSIL
ncbi:MULTISPECIES: 3-methylornithyl-N6-L-lysine dehydrogenase PylD [unclassified Methanosarcina]|uniref:3-methylornithyl-N6-L-lysine dehydrogenase PylD n=1 Tax=unclassified Methanosarcina TaxID=2644672 RepID=UPI000615A30B|nr:MULTISPECIES: 3-methylornithyl-N6-L-lysine dehydrogenase PylD [unclassified Methanosarcina]AKB20145.1 Proline reductase for pyrrolysine biosynthesis [Methanosarcina sp. WWM596]AKB23342.1 Proline reductase for pyrrolysine biosynthesis [Methanosarcina sp. WH1]